MNPRAKSIAGNALAQYGIIIAIVAVAIIPAFFFLGKNIVDQLTNIGVGLETTSVVNNSTDGSIVTPKGLGDSLISDDEPGSTGDAEISCVKDNCSIDFGPYKITGIPENFGEFIETAGSSGGSIVLADLLEQIAKNPELTNEESYLIEKLANKGHSLASIEEMIEVQAQILVDNASTPDANFEMDGDVLQARLTEFNDLCTQVESLLASKPETKDIVGVLAGNIVGLATDMSLAHQVAINSCVTEGSCANDVLTGATIETEPYNASLDDIINPEASSVSDVDSALICASGGSNDDGTKCN